MFHLSSPVWPATFAVLCGLYSGFLFAQGHPNGGVFFLVLTLLNFTTFLRANYLYL